MLDYPEFKRWFMSALKTLESAKLDYDHGFYSWACFKSHQAAEKALKALLWGLGRPRTGRSLPVLLSWLGNVLGNIPDDIKEYCIRLNKMYIPTRYPCVERGNA